MKNVLIRFLSVLLAFPSFVAAQLLMVEPAHASAAPDVVINEVMWMGSSLYGSSDDWIELLNTGASGDVDISGWKLTNSSTAADEILVIPDSTVISSGELFLISRFAAGNSVLKIDADWIADTVAGNKLELDNTCEQIDLTKSDDTLADSMGCDGGYYYPANSATKHALERNIEIGSGTDVNSWHERTIGSANLDDLVTDLATPKFVNDVTAADVASAIVNDGLAADINWSDSLTEASANWSGFVDPESGLSGEYNVELLDSTDTVIDSAAVTGMSHTFSSLSLSEGEIYRFAVSAINGVGLESLTAESDGFTVDTANPEPASNLIVTDVASDNGGSLLVQWDASASLDEITYRVDYHKVGSATVLSQNTGNSLEATINGLENGPVVYELMIVATDFSGRESLINPTTQGSALDNLAPLLDTTKLTVSQNKPGTNDMVSGAAGTSSEAATVTIFDRHPTDPMAIVLASVQTNVGFGFDAVSIGDNRYPTVWLQLVDAGGNASAMSSLNNDIVGPTTPTITVGKVICKSVSCRVELSWTGTPDSTAYVVEYGSGVNVKRTVPISNTTLILDLPVDGNHYSFVVYALDQFGNISGQSNVFSASLVAGVVTIGTLIDGALVVTTAAVEGSKETLQSTTPTTPAKLVPAAVAANDMTVNVAGQQDWLRIAIVVVLLLIVAGGFYSLSRSMQTGPLDIPEKPTARKVAAKKRTSKRRKRS